MQVVVVQELTIVQHGVVSQVLVAQEVVEVEELIVLQYFHGRAQQTEAVVVVAQALMQAKHKEVLEVQAL
jgi:hypothetical protein